MPPRKTLPRGGTFYPSNDSATYRDLLLFEERLKTNAAALKRRKSRYRLFLLQLLVIIAFLLSEVHLQTNFLAIPYALFLRKLLPDIYTPETPVLLHPYFASGMLFVSVTTLVLFFASGMYSEKIGYANRYVPHANKALRSFNMYLNVRQPPLRSKYPLKALLTPFSVFFSANPDPTTPTSPRTPRRSPSPSPLSARSPSSARPITSIPPSTNPRGELIFSSRVAPAFREGYERYRSAFERKRAERASLMRANTWLGWLTIQVRNRVLGPVIGVKEEKPVVVSLPPSRTPSSAGRGRPGSTQGSRKGSPIPRGRVPRGNTPPVPGGPHIGQNTGGSPLASEVTRSNVDES
ncbi:hypothetical protein PUNSTDRAFT_56786 [Punctularia strigosozonata HHB-11173 SS5]|uniref:uncharacterized protein n=1 Tax=Punctularia strigosozonata (strain HHB-11173) TaxID=741275 RepID=UPI00044170A4|nr:uncharacterized protein PUNSTDRAFT_56786 [Punctularia strigosozonata HHB-11173 SS5]EIN13818.1 hypothetical protein PUNSTDRAFT_56786 [Punctularia strigosozonata HHB-11173 SS5]